MTPLGTSLLSRICFEYYTAFLGGFAAMPLTSGIIKRLIRFIRNKYDNSRNCNSAIPGV